MKNRINRLLLTAALFFSGCGNVTHPALEEFSVPKYTPRYASGFEISRTDDGESSLLRIRNPWQGADRVEQLLFIGRDGEPLPAGFTGQAVKAPVRHVVCMSSSHVAMFDALGQMRRVAGVSGIDYLSSDYIREHRYCGEVRDVGYDTNLNFELLAAMRPDLILLYGVTGENTVVTGKLQELGIPYIYIGDYMEESPLGKAEWLMAVAELAGCEQAGAALFEGICHRYDSLKQAAALRPRDTAPKVMLNTPYRDTWFMPSSKGYMVRLIEDAGGEYVYEKNSSNTSVPVDLEEAYLLANEADVWLNLGPLNTLGELKSQNPRFAEVPAVQAGRVYNNNRRQTPAGGSDFWESGVVRPDRVLEDLILLFRGGNADSAYYYKQLQ